MTVPSGATCTLVPGTTVNGNVQVGTGGTLIDHGAAIGGNLQANGATRIVLDGGGTIRGNLQIQGLSSAPSGSHNALCNTVVRGNVQIQGNSAASLIDIGNVGVCSGGAGLTVSGNLQVQNNVGQVSLGGNSANGNIQVQNNTGGGTLTANSAAGTCQLQGNAPGIAGSGNAVPAGHTNTCNRTA